MKYFLIAISLLSISACSSVDNEIPKIKGQIMPSAPLQSTDSVRILVSLLDVSKEDEPAVALSQTSMTIAQTWPASYVLPYDPKSLKTFATYAVQVQVSDASGDLVAITDTQHEFSSNSDTEKFDLLVRNLVTPGKQSDPFEIKCGRSKFAVTFFPEFLVKNNLRKDSRQVFNQIESASGSKFQRGVEILWFKGDEASYDDGVENKTCEVRS